MANIYLMKPGLNMFDGPATTLVIPVNKVGVMGAGLAKYAKLRDPGLFKAYSAHCQGEWKGRLFFYRDTLRIDSSRHNYLCFATKDDWRYSSQMEWIQEGMRELRDHYQDWKIHSIAIPALGCGRGDLTWEKVLSLILTELDGFEGDLTVYLYPPH